MTTTLSLSELKALAGEPFCRAYECARQRNGRMPPPPTPCRECLAAFGQKLGWRTGSAAAIKAAESLSLQKLCDCHITAELAARWALFYINERQRNRRNPSAAGRARYLIRAALLLRNTSAQSARDIV
ncbi:MAG: hypothetical protein RMM31_10330 [Anaerolineae bacterium]|nr:hypothetical protein [Thermoflexales bacterium]MDW8396624.1 hypothetical protein [Anaerolineae bacterium]